MALTHEPDPRFLIAQAPQWAVVLNKNQDLLGRCYLLLKRPETDPLNLTDGELSELWAVARKVKQVLGDLWEPDHYNYAFLMNVDPQVHFHIIPRYKNRREFAGGTFVDPMFGDHYTISPARTLEDGGYDAILTALRSRF
jgi:diadenosine tetraphosphate (Ap4A) HIT family hydrolase